MNPAGVISWYAIQVNSITLFEIMLSWGNKRVNKRWDWNRNQK